MRIFSLIILVFVLTGCDAVSLPDTYNTSETAVGWQNITSGSNSDTTVVSDGTIVTEEASIVSKPDEQSIEVPVKLPSTFNSNVPFASQAPLDDWELPYQEACEEASLIMVSRFFHDQVLDNNIMNREILAMVAWEKENFGLYTDTSADEVLRIATEYLGLHARLVYDISEERIKRELVSGNLIIAPFSGRDLGNKFFSEPGPLYHMLVIRGYDRNEFITNDVGTRHGEAYKYKYDTLINAIHDLPRWQDGSVIRLYDDMTLSDSTKLELIRAGKPVMIVISRDI